MSVGKVSQILPSGTILPSAIEPKKLILQVDDDGILTYRYDSSDSGSLLSDSLIIGQQQQEQKSTETRKIVVDEHIIREGRKQLRELNNAEQKVADGKRKKVATVQFFTCF